jgi:protein-S-isoprenylcysteine O-methyltransferase Ste14
VGRLLEIIKVTLSAPIVLMVLKVYIPVLFPLTFLIALVALKLDALLGFGAGFLPSPANYYIAAGSFVAGALWWVWTYYQLVSIGKGSPSPTAGRTQQLVKSGIYAYCRNPSIHGKLLGVLSVGFAMNSFAFCCVLVPALLAVSLVEKVVRQEPQLVEVFGDEYVEYQKRVPLFIPWGIVFPSKRWVETP